MKKVSPGQPLRISAEEHNAFIDAALAEQSRALQQGVEPKSRASGIVLVRNDTGVDQDRFAILALDGPLISPTDNFEAFCNTIAFSGIVPRSWHKAKFAVIASPLAAEKICPAIVHGPTVVKLDVAPGEEDDHFADVWDNRSDVLKPKSLNAGAMILWRQSGTGEKWAIVRLSNPYSDFA